MHRETNTGKVYCPYCEKENTHIGNLKAHITGFAGRKCKKSPATKPCQKYGKKSYKGTFGEIKQTTIKVTRVTGNGRSYRERRGRKEGKRE